MVSRERIFLPNQVYAAPGRASALPGSRDRVSSPVPTRGGIVGQGSVVDRLEMCAHGCGSERRRYFVPCLGQGFWARVMVGLVVVLCSVRPWSVFGGGRWWGRE